MAPLTTQINSSKACRTSQNKFPVWVPLGKTLYLTRPACHDKRHYQTSHSTTFCREIRITSATRRKMSLPYLKLELKIYYFVICRISPEWIYLWNLNEKTVISARHSERNGGVKRHGKLNLQKICGWKEMVVLNVSESRELLIKAPLEKLSITELTAPVRPSKRMGLPSNSPQ